MPRSKAVWVVCYWDYEPLAVFTSKKAAMAHAEALRGPQPDDRYHIMKFTLNETSEGGEFVRC